MSVLSLLKGKQSDESEPEGLLGVVKQHLDNEKILYMLDIPDIRQRWSSWGRDRHTVCPLP